MGPKGILVDSDLLALQGQLGTKEIQVIRGSLVKQVLEQGDWSFFRSFLVHNQKTVQLNF